MQIMMCVRVLKLHNIQSGKNEAYGNLGVFFMDPITVDDTRYYLYLLFL